MRSIHVPEEEINPEFLQWMKAMRFESVLDAALYCGVPHNRMRSIARCKVLTADYRAMMYAYWQSSASNVDLQKVFAKTIRWREPTKTEEYRQMIRDHKLPPIDLTPIIPQPRSTT